MHDETVVIMMLVGVGSINNDGSVKGFQKSMMIKKRVAEFSNGKDFGLKIKHGFVINPEKCPLEK